MNGRRSGILGIALAAVMCLTAPIMVDAAVDVDNGQVNGAEIPVRSPAHHLSTADHSKFKVLNQNFATGQEVTLACLSCHTEAGHQFQQTYHWTWKSVSGEQKGIGKKNVLNNF